MTTKLSFLLFTGVDLARQVGVRTLLTLAARGLRWLGRALVDLNAHDVIDAHTMKELGMSRAQFEAELARLPWQHYPPY